MTVGEKLKKAREKKHLSIETVSEKTRIHPKILEAIEQNDAESLLNRVYIKGFLRGYAGLVGLNEEQVVEEYLATVPRKPTPVLTRALTHTALKEEKEDSPWVRKVTFLLAGTIILFLIGLGISKIPWGRMASFSMHRHQRVSLEAGSFYSYPFRIPKDTPLQLKLRANENTWVTIHSDGRLLYQGLLSKGKEETWEAERRLELSLSDGGAVWFGLNRKSLGIPGQKGRPLENILITREGWGLGGTS